MGHMPAVTLGPCMLLLPIKMVLRWSINLKYFIAIPEYLLNF